MGWHCISENLLISALAQAKLELDVHIEHLVKQKNSTRDVQGWFFTTSFFPRQSPLCVCVLDALPGPIWLRQTLHPCSKDFKNSRPKSQTENLRTRKRGNKRCIGGTQPESFVASDKRDATTSVRSTLQRASSKWRSGCTCTQHNNKSRSPQAHEHPYHSTELCTGRSLGPCMLPPYQLTLHQLPSPKVTSLQMTGSRHMAYPMVVGCSPKIGEPWSE